MKSNLILAILTKNGDLKLHLGITTLALKGLKPPATKPKRKIEMENKLNYLVHEIFSPVCIKATLRYKEHKPFNPLSARQTSFFRKFVRTNFKSLYLPI